MTRCGTVPASCLSVSRLLWLSRDTSKCKVRAYEELATLLQLISNLILRQREVRTGRRVGHAAVFSHIATSTDLPGQFG